MRDFFRQLTIHQRRLAVVIALILCVHVGITAYHRTRKVGDFDVLRGFGAELLRGDVLYAEGLCYNYMPITALYNMPSALTPAWIASIWRSLAALGCLALTVVWLKRMTPGSERSPREWFTLAALALLLAAHYIIRDLDDAGPHTILLAMLIGGAYCLWQSRERWAAAWFGLAIALKMTPGLLLPFFVWKRQFRLAFYTGLATAAWIALPAVWMGPQAWWTAQYQWTTSVAIRALSGESDHNEQRIQNQALKPALERLLTTYAPDDRRKLDHPLDVPVLDLEPRTARAITGGVMLALLAAFAWQTWRPYQGPHDPARLSEFAGLLIMMTLFSPVTWLQHLPWVLPCTCLLVERYRSTGLRDRTLQIGLGLYAFMVVVINRELVGRETYYLLLSWHMHTLCQLLLLGMLATTRRPAVSAYATAIDDTSTAKFDAAPAAVRRAA